MSDVTCSEAIDYILDCYNLRKVLREIDNTIWEPTKVVGNDIFSCMDGRKMTREEFLKKWPSGTWPDIRLLKLDKIPFPWNRTDNMSERTMRAKLTIESVNKLEWAEMVRFTARYDSKDTKEDNSYSEASPAATAEITITNKELWGKLVPGQRFYVDFTPC